MTAKGTMIAFDEAAWAKVDPGYVALGESWRRALRANNVSAKTVETYLAAWQRFGVFLAQHRYHQEPADITRAEIEEWLIWMREEGYSDATVLNRYRGIQNWFHWLFKEDEIEADPTAKMKPPTVPDNPKRILTDEEVRALLKVCNGKDFMARRDLAMISLLFDTGARREGVATIRMDRLWLDDGLVEVQEKGRRARVIGMGTQTVMVIDRYLRSRKAHRFASSERLFLGLWGPLTGDGLYQIFKKRAASAGITDVSPHSLRHTYAHLFLEAGGQESDLMAQAGWNSPSMVRHYGRALRQKRGAEAAKRLSPRDRLGI